MAEKSTNDDNSEEDRDLVEMEISEPEEVDFHDDEHDDEHEDVSGSLASRALTGIVLIVLGGSVALWLGPKIAPSLPSGMAPVANWLSSSHSQTSDQIAALSASIDARFDAMAEPVAVTEIDAMILKSTAAVNADLSARIDNLAGQVNSTDNAALATRIGELEGKIEGLRAELSALTGQLTAISTAGGEVSAETSAQIATYSAALAGLNAEISAMSDQNLALSQKIDEVSATSTQQAAEAETVANEMAQVAEAERKTAVIQSSITALDVALSAGTSFQTILDDLAAVDAPAVPAALSDTAGGVITMSQLRSDFPEAAHAAIRVENMMSADDGAFAFVKAIFRSQIAGRSLTPQEGDTADAILSRAEEALKHDDLAAALAEIANLGPVSMPSEARGPMAEWIENANTRFDAIKAFGEYSSALEN